MKDSVPPLLKCRNGRSASGWMVSVKRWGEADEAAKLITASIEAVSG